LVQESYTNTLFDDLSKHLNNNPDLYKLVFNIVINGKKITFNASNPILGLAHTFGILRRDERGLCRTNNRVFEKRIYDLMLSMEEINAI